MKACTCCFYLLFFPVLLFAYGPDGHLDSLQQQLSSAKNLVDSLDVTINTGDAYFEKDDYKNALKYYFSALNLAGANEKHKSMGAASNGVGNSYYHLGEYQNALKYYQNALGNYEQTHDTTAQGGVLNNLALVYFDSDSLELAQEFFEKALEFKKNQNKRTDMAAIYHNLGMVYSEKGEYGKAREYLGHALDIFRELGNGKYEANTLNNIGRAYEKNNQYGQASDFFNQAMKKAKANHASYILMDNYFYQASYYAGRGDYKKAYLFHKYYHDLKDSLNNLEKEKQIAEVQAKYENEIRDRQNRFLVKQNETNEALIQKQYVIGIATGIAAVLLAMLVVFLYYSYRQKQKANKLLEQQKDQIEEKNKKLAALNDEVTSQKQDLEELNQIKDKLFSIISHEFRSPLNSLKGTLSLLNAGVLTGEELTMLSRDLTDKINNTSIFLDNLLNWAKSQMNGIVTTPANVDLQMLVDDNIKLLVTQAEKKDILLVSHIKNPMVAYIDANMMSLVLKNLITNAIKFSRQGGSVEIAAETIDHKIAVSIKDQGIGMAEENINKLFDQETFTTRGTANERGTGLGLFISKNFIENNGGKIRIDSKEGQGSTFRFTVPLATQH